MEILQSLEDKLSNVRYLVIGIGIHDRGNWNTIGIPITDYLKDIAFCGSMRNITIICIFIPDFDGVFSKTCHYIKAFNIAIESLFLCTVPLNASEIDVQKSDIYGLHYSILHK